MYPHRIRLRGPWTCQSLATGELTRVTMPCRWRDVKKVAGPFFVEKGPDTFLCVRPFGYPGRIDECERVWLTFAGVDGSAIATLNGQRLGHWQDGPAEFDVTAILKARNQLAVEVESSTLAGGLWGEVALEVRRTAYLQDVHFHQPLRSALTVEGKVVGLAERPLELYLFAQGHSVAYQQIDASANGTPFEMTAELESTTAALAARVELVDVATIWYVVQAPNE